jgi:class 3 adenylate cyclase
MLTDGEGSTRLWESASEAMGAAVARHYKLLGAAVALYGGVRPLEQGEGDSVVGVLRPPWPPRSMSSVRFPVRGGPKGCR